MKRIEKKDCYLFNKKRIWNKNLIGFMISSEIDNYHRTPRITL